MFGRVSMTVPVISMLSSLDIKNIQVVKKAAHFIYRYLICQYFLLFVLAFCRWR